MSAPEPTLYQRLVAAPLVEAARREWEAEDDAAAAEDRRIEWSARAVAGTIALACIGGAAWLTM